jgi:hypothetical protein
MLGVRGRDGHAIICVFNAIDRDQLLIRLAALCYRLSRRNSRGRVAPKISADSSPEDRGDKRDSLPALSAAPPRKWCRQSGFVLRKVPSAASRLLRLGRCLLEADAGSFAIAVDEREPRFLEGAAEL